MAWHPPDLGRKATAAPVHTRPIIPSSAVSQDIVPLNKLRSASAPKKTPIGAKVTKTMNRTPSRWSISDLHRLATACQRRLRCSHLKDLEVSAATTSRGPSPWRVRAPARQAQIPCLTPYCTEIAVLVAGCYGSPRVHEPRSGRGGDRISYRDDNRRELEL